jgi:putative hemolysin
VTLARYCSIVSLLRPRRSERGRHDVRIERESAAIGILVTLDEPTKPMQHEATIAGAYHSDVSGKDYPRIQILSVADLRERGLRPQLPPLVSAPLQRAAKVTAPVDQATMFGEPG